MLNIGMLKNIQLLFLLFISLETATLGYIAGVVFGCCHGDLLTVQDHLTAPLSLRAS